MLDWELFVFIVVLFAFDPVRRAIVGVFGFLFGGVFTLFGKLMDPILEFFKSGAERFIEENLEEPESGFVDFELQGELNTYGNTSSIFEYTTYGLAFLILIIIAISPYKKKREEAGCGKTGNLFIFI